MRALSLRPPTPTFARALAWALALAALAPAAARADVTVRTLDQDLPAAGLESVAFRGQVGEVQVVGTSGESVKLEVALLCDRERDRDCREAAARVDLRVRRSGDRLQLAVEDWPKLRGGGLSIRARLELPKHLAVEVDMGVGEVSVAGVEADVEVDTGVGEVTVEAREAHFRSVKMDTGVGEVTLEVGGRTVEGSGFVGGHLSWRRGPGQGHIEVDTGVGEIRVVLR
jgi:hypothetical protein